MPHQFAGRLDAAHSGQSDVHHHQVGIGLAANLNPVGAAARLAYYLEFRVAQEDLLDRIAQHLMVVNEHNAERHKLVSP